MLVKLTPIGLDGASEQRSKNKTIEDEQKKYYERERETGIEIEKVYESKKHLE